MPLLDTPNFGRKFAGALPPNPEGLHCLMAALVMEGSALAKLRARKRRELRVCVRKIAQIYG